MKGRVTVFLATIMLTALPGIVGNATAQPGPEQKKLEYFVGKWRTDVDIKASAAAPASKVAGSDECEWFANLHVVCRAEATGAAGLYKSMRVISYVAALKQYAQYSVDSLGYAVFAVGQVQGNTWTFTTELPGMKFRSIIKTSGDSFTSQSDYAGADGKWIPTSTGKSTRMK